MIIGDYVRFITSSEDMPRVSGGFRRHDRGFSIAKIVREGVFKADNFFFEAGVRGRLCFREDKRTSCVPTRAQR
jgi:hypothetical protein